MSDVKREEVKQEGQGPGEHEPSQRGGPAGEHANDQQADEASSDQAWSPEVRYVDDDEDQQDGLDRNGDAHWDRGNRRAASRGGAEDRGQLAERGPGEDATVMRPGAEADAQRMGQALADEEKEAGYTPVPQKGKKQAEPTAPQEWELFEDIPLEMQPRPLLKVTNIIPGAEGVSEDALRELLEAQELRVLSVAFDAAPGAARGVAFVRLAPPPLSWLKVEATNEEEAAARLRMNRKRSRGMPGASVDGLAEGSAKKLNALSPKLALGGQDLQFIAQREQVTLYIGNLSEEWQDVERLKADMARHGRLERVFIARNTKGQSKNYAIAEFCTPHGAQRAKRSLDEVEAAMRPENARRAAGGRVEQVKLLRSEFAAVKSIQSQFSRTLFVANLPQRYKDVRELRGIFEEYGGISDVNIPVNQMTQQSRGFAFVEFKRSTYADMAYRAFDALEEHPKLGRMLVSFANPAKPGNERERNRSAGGQDGAARAGQQQQQRGGGGGGGIGVGMGMAGDMSGPRMGPGPMMGGPGFPMPGRGGFPGGNLGPRGFDGPGPRGGMGRGGMGRGGMGGDFNRMGPVGPGGMDPMVPPHMQMAQMQQMAMQRQVQAQMARQMAAQQAAMQEQLRAAQAAAQAAQAEAALYQRTAAQAQAKAAAEAEARRRAEEEARKAAVSHMGRPGAAPMAADAYGGKGQWGVQGAGYGYQAGAGYEAAAGPATAAAAASAGYGAGYGEQAGYGAERGYGGAGQAGYGRQDAYGPAAYGDYAGKRAAQGVSGYQGQAGYGQGAADGSGYGAAAGGFGDAGGAAYAADAASSYNAGPAAGAAAGYSSQGYDAAAYAAAGYSSKAEYEQQAAAYGAGGAWQAAGQAGGGGWGGAQAQSAQAAGGSAAYDASTGQGGYGSYAAYAQDGGAGHAYKRARY